MSPRPAGAAPDAATEAARRLLRTLHAALRRGPSATDALERWCAAHGLADAPRVVAERIDGGRARPADAARRRRLRVGQHEPIRYRRVRLRCGPLVLSDAENWYVPARLTPGMNRALAGSAISFGHAVRALRFRRRTLAASFLWLGAGPPPAAGRAVLRHHAGLARPDGLPFSEVVEAYRAVLIRPPA